MQVAFDVDIDVTREKNSPFLSAITKCFDGIQECLRDPFWRVSVTRFPFQRSVSEAVKFIRGFGKKVIQERREAVLRGDDIPHDVLTSILSLEEKESGITDEDLVDAFDTFFIGGVYLALCKANMRVVVGLAACGLQTSILTVNRKEEEFN